MIYIASWNEAWHHSFLGYIYRLHEGKYQFMNLNTEEWEDSNLDPIDIEDGIKSGALKQVGDELNWSLEH